MTTQISPAERPRLRRGFDDLHGEFVAHHAGILQERVLALEDVIVGAADADPARTDQRVPRIGPRGGPLLDLQPAGLGANKGVDEFHVTTCRFREIWRRMHFGRPRAGGVPALAPLT